MVTSFRTNRPKRQRNIKTYTTNAQRRGGGSCTTTHHWLPGVCRLPPEVCWWTGEPTHSSAESVVCNNLWAWILWRLHCVYSMDEHLYVNLLVLMVVLMLLTLKMYMVQYQCLHENSSGIEIFIYDHFTFVYYWSKSMNVKITGAVLNVQSLYKL